MNFELWMLDVSLLAFIQINLNFFPLNKNTIVKDTLKSASSKSICFWTPHHALSVVCYCFSFVSPDNACILWGMDMIWLEKCQLLHSKHQPFSHH